MYISHSEFVSIRITHAMQIAFPFLSLSMNPLSDLVKSLIRLLTIQVVKPAESSHILVDLERVSQFIYSIQHSVAYVPIPFMRLVSLRRRRDQAESSFLAKCGAKEGVGVMFA